METFSLNWNWTEDFPVPENHGTATQAASRLVTLTETNCERIGGNEAINWSDILEKFDLVNNQSVETSQNKMETFVKSTI